MKNPELLKSNIKTSTNNCHNIISDMALIGNTIRLEERFDCEATKERRPYRVWKLVGDNTVAKVLARVVINRY